MIVTLTGIPNASRVTVSLTGVNGSASAAASLGFLVGDINHSRTVTAADVSAMRARSGHVATQDNFQFDLNMSGTIGAADVAAAKTRLLTVLP